MHEPSTTADETHSNLTISGLGISPVAQYLRNAYRQARSEVYVGQIPRRAHMPDRFNGGEFVIRPRVFLADDHADFLKAEIALLQPHFELVGIASDGASLVSEVQRLKPDVVVVDITMPVMNGIEAVHKLVQSGSTAKFVFLTIHSGEEFIKACLEEGARGYVVKSQMKAHLIPAIRAAVDGQPYLPPSMPT